MNYVEIVDRNLDNFFWDILNSRTSYMRKVQPEYKKIYAELLDIEKEESLREFFDEQKIKSLSEAESEMILRYLQLVEDRHVLDLKDLFYSAFAVSDEIQKRLDEVKSELD